MDKIKKILAPTDLTEDSKEGVRYALNLAMALGAQVTTYYVVSQGEILRLYKTDSDPEVR